MRYILLLLLSCCLCNIYAQNIAYIINNEGDRKEILKNGNFIQCRYKLNSDYSFLAGGIIRNITDSTIIYSTTSLTTQKLIPISAIINIDKISVKRSIVPAIVLGVIVGVTDGFINPQRSKTISGLIAAPAIIIGVNYVFKWDHRHLNRNRVGQTVKLLTLSK